MTPPIPATASWMLITRINGKSSSRVQRRYRNWLDLQRGVVRRRADGATVFWIYGPAPTATGERPLIDHWAERT